MKNTKTENEAAVLAKIAQMPEPLRSLGERLHALIMRSVPALQPRLWYGMPGYAMDGPVLCFFRADDPYMTFGLTEKANFEQSPHDLLMPCAWFFTALDSKAEQEIAEIVRKAAS